MHCQPQTQLYNNSNSSSSSDPEVLLQFRYQQKAPTGQRDYLDNIQESPTVWTRQDTLDAATHGARRSISLQICVQVPSIPQVYPKIFIPQGPTQPLTPQQQVLPVFTPVALGVVQPPSRQ